MISSNNLIVLPFKSEILIVSIASFSIGNFIQKFADVGLGQISTSSFLRLSVQWVQNKNSNSLYLHNKLSKNGNLPIDELSAKFINVLPLFWMDYIMTSQPSST